MHAVRCPDSVRRVRSVLSQQQCQQSLAEGQDHDEKGCARRQRGQPCTTARRRPPHLLSAIVPAIMTPSDPVSFRNIVFRIHVDQITGRQAST